MPTLQHQAICLSNATFIIAEDKASKNRNRFHCHQKGEWRNKQCSAEEQILSLPARFHYLYHYLHLAGVITGHKYYLVSVKKADAGDTKRFVPYTSKLSNIQFAIYTDRQSTGTKFQGTSKTQEIKCSRADSWKIVILVLKVKNLSILQNFVLPEIKYDLSKPSKIISRESIGSAVSGTYMLKLQSSLAKSSIFSLWGDPDIKPHPAIYPWKFKQKHRIL